MSLRELLVLGTSSQVPTRHRNHNGYLLRWDGQGFLFDPGEGTQRQFIYAGVAVTAVTKIFITHFHGDHCLGLAGIIQRLSLDRVTHPVEVYFPETGMRYFERLVGASIYHRACKPIPRPVPLSSGIVGREGELTIEAFPLDHAVDTVGYRISESDQTRFLPERLTELGLKGPVVGRLQREGKIEHQGKIITRDDVSWRRRGARFGFIMDTRLSDGCFDIARDVDLLVCESTFLEEDRKLAREYKHMTARQAAEVASQAGARSLLLTHFSQRYADTRLFRREAREIFDPTRSARDLARFPFLRPEDAAREAAGQSIDDDDSTPESEEPSFRIAGAEDAALAASQQNPHPPAEAEESALSMLAPTENKAEPGASEDGHLDKGATA